MFTVYKVADVKINWNGSATFNVYVKDENVHCFTHYGVESFADAKGSAIDWLDNEYNWSDYIAGRINV